MLYRIEGRMEGGIRVRGKDEGGVWYIGSREGLRGGVGIYRIEERMRAGGI